MSVRASVGLSHTSRISEKWVEFEQNTSRNMQLCPFCRFRDKYAGRTHLMSELCQTCCFLRLHRTFLLRNIWQNLAKYFFILNPHSNRQHSLFLPSPVPDIPPPYFAYSISVLHPNLFFFLSGLFIYFFFFFFHLRVLCSVLLPYIAFLARP